ncbi:DgyrCDS12149 [Dimorphilus gyrociliatus]|uniref:D-dopachrome decarboxylase n=1 Tax=Dimorphilus gyrociliatus TaxID=2664684 RepID=A0A7I8W7G2_9ANNE|nr:DgyrCDS12149 [Dimorphilus gyrociliatus]
MFRSALARISRQTAGVSWQQNRTYPVCTFNTNLPQSQVDPNFEAKFSDYLSKLLNKPKERIYIQINGDCRMCSNNDKETRMLMASIKSIGVFNENSNKVLGPEIRDYLCEHFGVDKMKITLLLQDLKQHEAAHIM